MIIPYNHYDWENNRWLDTYIDKHGHVSHIESRVKPIKGYEGLYSVYDSGYVYSHLRKKFLKPRNNGKGYQQVLLYKDKKAKAFYIHRLVAQAFLPNIFPEIEWDVDHINNDTGDNRVTNLQYVTRHDNLYLKEERGNITMNELQTSLFNETPSEKEQFVQTPDGIYNFYLREIDRIAARMAIANFQKRFDDSQALKDSLMKSIEKEPLISSRQYLKFLNILQLETQLFENKITESWEK